MAARGRRCGALAEGEDSALYLSLLKASISPPGPHCRSSERRCHGRMLQGVDHKAAVILSDERGRGGYGRGSSSIGVVNEAGSTFIRSGRGARRGALGRRREKRALRFSCVHDRVNRLKKFVLLKCVCVFCYCKQSAQDLWSATLLFLTHPASDLPCSTRPTRTPKCASTSRQSG